MNNKLSRKERRARAEARRKEIEKVILEVLSSEYRKTNDFDAAIKAAENVCQTILRKTRPQDRHIVFQAAGDLTRRLLEIIEATSRNKESREHICQMT